MDKTASLGCRFGPHQVACVDYDNDSWADLHCAGILWRNQQGKAFKKVGQYGRRAIWADFDNDGDPDAFCYARQKLFENNQGEFHEHDFPELSIESSLGACWADFNGDGYVDLYIGGYENWKKKLTFPDVLVLNCQGETWKKVWSETRCRARGVTACDFDRDGDMDIYVSNYRLQPNRLWRNDGAGTLVDVAISHRAVATEKGFAGGHSIGAVWADFDGDGNFDLFAGNFAHDDHRGGQPQSMFLRNTGPENDFVFESKGQGGLAYQESYASPAAADFDNDGDIDLFFTTVYATASRGKKNYPVLYRNEGDWHFVDVTEDMGLGKLPPTYQAAWADLDRNGFVDLVTAGKVFYNQGNGNHWLRIKLVGDGKAINCDAIGSQVRIRLANKTLTRQVEAGIGQGNQNEAVLHFGLGDCQDPVDVVIFWTKDITQNLHQVQVDRLITVAYVVSDAAKEESSKDQSAHSYSQ